MSNKLYEETSVQAIANALRLKQNGSDTTCESNNKITHHTGEGFIWSEAVNINEYKYGFADTCIQGITGESYIL